LRYCPIAFPVAASLNTAPAIAELIDDIVPHPAYTCDNIHESERDSAAEFPPEGVMAMDLADQQQFDTIVVGSGPGGGTVARELAQRGEHVLILERGPNRPISGTSPQMMREMMVPGKSLLITPKLLGLVRGITAGGSSIFYYATAFEPNHEILDKHGVDIRSEVEEAKAELPYGELADDLIGPMASRIMESAQDLGYGWKKLPKLVFQEHCRPDCDKCTLGCPYGAKWSSRFFLDEAVDNGAVLLDRTRVERVLVEDGEAVGVEAVSSGGRQRYRGSKVVLSAGGVGTPVILRASGIKSAGYDFFYDPLVVVIGVVGDDLGGREFPMATGIHMEDDGYVMTDLAWPRWLYQLFTAEVLRFGKVFSHARALPIMVKIRDALSGRLTDGGGVRKEVTDIDKAKIRSGFQRSKEILERAGAKSVFKTRYLAAHPGGTAKIGDVVDSDLKTEIDNLYACDCSVIPDELGLPPTLTILGLGKRLASHLAGKAMEA
jgi:choline dehydrogenase-like flavoprotein